MKEILLSNIKNYVDINSMVISKNSAHRYSGVPRNKVGFVYCKKITHIDHKNNVFRYEPNNYNIEEKSFKKIFLTIPNRSIVRLAHITNIYDTNNHEFVPIKIIDDINDELNSSPILINSSEINKYINVGSFITTRGNTKHKVGCIFCKKVKSIREPNFVYDEYDYDEENSIFIPIIATIRRKVRTSTIYNINAFWDEDRKSFRSININDNNNIPSIIKTYKDSGTIDNNGISKKDSKTARQNYQINRKITFEKIFHVKMPYYYDPEDNANMWKDEILSILKKSDDNYLQYKGKIDLKYAKHECLDVYTIDNKYFCNVKVTKYETFDDYCERVGFGN
jgi:hypothetical protein